MDANAAGVEEEEEENKALLTEELVASLRDTVGVFFRRVVVFFFRRLLDDDDTFFSLLSFDDDVSKSIRDATTADERRPSLSFSSRERTSIVIRECTSSRTSSTSILSRGKTTMGKDGRTKAF